VIRPARMLLILPAALALALASCGRKGSLDLPPSASVAQPPPAAATEQQFGPDGRPVAPPGTKKQLPIDWLLN
jgi:predicted small lipoprotein YifL